MRRPESAPQFPSLPVAAAGGGHSYCTCMWDTSLYPSGLADFPAEAPQLGLIQPVQYAPSRARLVWLAMFAPCCMVYSCCAGLPEQAEMYQH